MTRTFIFLDIDGVCNNTMNETYFDSFNMANVKDLVEYYGAKVVLSSDWRRNPKNLAVARSELLAIGIKIFDTTPIMSFVFRNQEIKQWLEENADVWDQAIILDDMTDELVDPKLPNAYFFLIDYHFGLTEEDCDKIKSIVRNSQQTRIV